MAHRLNAGIERLVYERPVRRLIGLRAAVILYAFLGITTNSLHSKIRPTTTLRSAAFWAPFTLGRCWVGAWSRAASLLRPGRSEHPSKSGGDADREVEAAPPIAARGR